MEVQSQPASTPTSVTTLSSGSAPSDGYLSARDDFDPTIMEESLSPVDLEALIQTERITKILDSCVYASKMAVCLPNLVQEFLTLSSILSSQDMDDLLFIFEQYDKPLFQPSFSNMDALEDIKSGVTTLKNRLNPDLGHLMYILLRYPALKPTVEEMVEKMKLGGQDGQMPPSLTYLVTLEQFRDLMVRQLSTTASQELAAKFRTKKLEAQNAKIIANIKEKSEALKCEREAFMAEMEAKQQKIKSLQDELQEVQSESSKQIKEKILDSERQMVLASRVHAVKNDILQDEQAETTRVYNTLLSTHVQEEKKLRARRLKVETQLLSWIKKYDLEMSDKQVELDDFQQKYDDEVRACRELEEKLKIQNTEYIPLMAEREEEYHREMKQKMEKFLLEHAARVIQSAWRTVLLHRAEKKKLWKIQKQQRKMQMEAEKLLKKKTGKKINKPLKSNENPELNKPLNNNDYAINIISQQNNDKTKKPLKRNYSDTYLMSESDRSSFISRTGSPCESVGTGSNASNATATVQDQRQRDDKSPIDIECNIQAERITKCLDKLVYQTKLAICIPTLLHKNILDDILPYDQLSQIKYITDHCQEPVYVLSSTNMSAVEDLQAGNMSLENRLNYDLSYLMHTLCSYPVLKPHVERIIKKGKENSHGLKYLLKVEEFRDLMVARMKTTAAEEINAIRNAMKLKKRNNDYLTGIEEDKKLLKEEKRIHDEQVREKLATIEQLKQELKLKGEKDSVKRRQQILDSERKMVLATRSHKVKVEMLKEEEVESREVYNNSVHSHMLVEKRMRDRRRKAETQLQSWLQKYDTEMQDKQGELDEINRDYEEEVQKCEDLKRKLAQQDKEFLPLMKEKEDEYHQEMTAKMDDFIIEHAAKVIQYAWRTTIRNREEKKKLLKLKKKMEMERAAAARKAEIEAKQQELLAKKQAAKERAAAKEASKAAKLEAEANKGKEDQDDS